MVLAVVAGVVGMILLVAGVPKLTDTDRVIRAVRGYQILPDAEARLVGRTLPWVELVLGAALIVGVVPEIAGAAAAALFAVFTVGLVINLARGRRDLDCGCFAFSHGAEEVPHIGWGHALRAGTFAALSVVSMWAPAAPAADRFAGAAIGVLVVALVTVVLYARTVMTFGRRGVDTYLTNAAIASRAAARASRY
ncbi:MauE/DoxX family redox-associated membrane protein [Gordonia sp. DT30]|uniref:MauE/DoxX family redox-associated membrane protein n=1 Tax=unclassified Gordonia (in: high G+C Gram-positive bacteria) TaxID=2657482 RepID=UPI003CE890FC